MVRYKYTMLNDGLRFAGGLKSAIKIKGIMKSSLIAWEVDETLSMHSNGKIILVLINWNKTPTINIYYCLYKIYVFYTYGCYLCHFIVRNESNMRIWIVTERKLLNMNKHKSLIYDVPPNVYTVHLYAHNLFIYCDDNSRKMLYLRWMNIILSTYDCCLFIYGW